METKKNKTIAKLGKEIEEKDQTATMTTEPSKKAKNDLVENAHTPTHKQSFKERRKDKAKEV